MAGPRLPLTVFIVFDILERGLAKVEVVYFREDQGSIPILDWFDALPPGAILKCLTRLGRLEELGHDLRRPEADYLKAGIYELRVKHSGVNYRMLYFFHGRFVVVVTHGFSKQQAKVPARELGAALRQKAEFEGDPSMHTFRPEA
jgi:phage-related protein